MSRQRRLIALVLVLVVIAAVGGWIARHFETTTEEVYRGFVGKAKRNPYLAAEYFLRRMGLEAHTLDSPEGLDRLPSPEATIIIPTERSTLGSERSQALLEWVRRGGHLILRIRRPIPGETDARDPLLDPLGIRGKDLGWEVMDTVTTTVIERPGTEDLLEVDFSQTYVLETDIENPLWEVFDPYGTRLIQVRLEKGRMSVLSEMDIWQNSSIDEYSHARLLYILARSGPGGEVLILRSDDMPPIWRWIWDRMPAVVIASLMLLIAWLLRAPRRFGPLLPATTPPRRRLLEHVEATGHYLWRAGCQEQLEEASRQALLRRLRQAQPHLADLRPEQLATRLSDLTGLGARRIEQALVGPQTREREQLMRRIQILEILRKRL